MIDPASAVQLASSALELAQYGGEALISLYRYYVDVKEAQIRAHDLRIEVGVCISLLHAIAADLETETTMSLNTEQLKAALNRFRVVIERLKVRVESKEVRGIRKLTWPFKKKENSELLDEIARCKATFSLALNIEQR